MTEDELKAYLSDNLKIELRKTWEGTIEYLEVTLMLNGDPIDCDYIALS